MKKLIYIVIAAVILVLAGRYAGRALGVNVEPIIGGGSTSILDVPPGFEGQLFASDLDGPRFITFGSDGDLYVAERGQGQVVVLHDGNGDGVAESRHTFADKLPGVHSLVFHDDWLYVGLPGGVTRLADRDGDGLAEHRETVVDDLPTSGHSTRTVIFLPDGIMLLSIGSSCNICEEGDERRAAIVAYDAESGQQLGLYASGLRNAVGLALHPVDGQLWASNNGRDLMGDDLPPETIYVVREGQDFGWPRCHSGRIEDPQFGYEGSCRGVAQPAIELQAHSAPLGLTFYDGDSFPAKYRGDLFVAYHGSWNRSIPTGYKVVRVMFNGSQEVTGVEDFATGWLDESTGQASGRPVGLAVGEDGALYVSDDKAGAIYRIDYR